MVERTYTIGEVSSMTGVEGRNNSTLRLWTTMFADWLSPSTRPVKGQLRLYTDNDVRTLMIVRDLRREHVPYAEIRVRLASMDAVVTTGPASVLAEERRPVEQRAPVGKDGGLREELSPLLAVAEAISPLVKDSGAVRIMMEIARFSASVETLNERLDKLQLELQEISRSRVPVGNLSEKSSAGVEVGHLTVSSTNSVRSVEVMRREEHAGQFHSVASTPSALAARGVVAGPEVVPPSAMSLNEHGLHPLPARFAGKALGSFYLCRQCGSTTRPLGVTPTSRVVLCCIECGERIVVPTADVEKVLGLSRSFWDWLKGLFRRK